MDNELEVVAEGIYRWTAPHPEWVPGEDWDRVVSSYAFADPETLVVVDPIGAPEGLAELAQGRKVSVLLSCPWHVRDSLALVKQWGASFHAPPPDEADPAPLHAMTFVAGDDLPGGFTALPGLEPNDLVLYNSAHSVMVFGDTLIDRGDGLIYPREWAAHHGDADAILASLQPLRELTVEYVLPTHGHPTNREALLSALD